MNDTLLEQILGDPTIPTSIRRALEAGATLEEIRLDSSGRWWHQQTPIENSRIVALFSRSVDRTEGGTFVLKIGQYAYPIAVEDTPYFVKGVTVDEINVRVTLHLMDETEEELEFDTLHISDTRLVARVKSGRFQARFLRSAYHQLLSYLDHREGGYVLNIGERVVPLDKR